MAVSYQKRGQKSKGSGDHRRGHSVSHKIWEELNADGQVVDRLDGGRIRLHVVYPFEMEHLLARTGFAVVALYGDFFRGGFRDDSSDMIWVARKTGF